MARAFMRVAAAGLAISIAAAGAAVPETDAERAVRRVNEARAALKLLPVALDPGLTAGCERHVEYMARNGIDGSKGLECHREDPAKPGRTEEGTLAARSSQFSFDDADPVAAVDRLLASLYHRVGFLDPRLARVGVVIRREPNVTMIDNCRGLDRTTRRWDRPIPYPAPGQKGVPRVYHGVELPPVTPEYGRPRGYPVTVSFAPRSRIQQALGTIQPAGPPPGEPLPAFFSSPEHPANAAIPDNFLALCLIAEEPLAPGTSYRAQFQAVVDGKPWSQAWEFTTEADPEGEGEAGPPPPPIPEEKPPPPKKKRKKAKAPETAP